VQGILNAVSVDNANQNIGVRDGVAGEMERMKMAIDESLEDLPRRKMRLAALRKGGDLR
jgi:hypothetical protein